VWPATVCHRAQSNEQKKALRDRKRIWRPVFEDLGEKIREQQRKAREQEALLEWQHKIDVVNYTFRIMALVKLYLSRSGFRMALSIGTTCNPQKVF